MFPGFQTITDLDRDAEIVRQRRYGMIDIVNGRLAGIHLRPFPKFVSLPEVWRDRRWKRGAGDRCRLYYNQPARCANFLTLKYIVSSSGATFASLHSAARMLDWLAELKRSDAVVCDVANVKISARLLHRWGWEPHAPSRWHRHYIKRFYGAYPSASIADLCDKSPEVTLADAGERAA